jgi:dolichol kinase
MRITEGIIFIVIFLILFILRIELCMPWRPNAKPFFKSEASVVWSNKDKKKHRIKIYIMMAILLIISATVERFYINGVEVATPWL